MGGLLAFVLVLGTIGWFLAQGRPSRSYVWSMRFQRWSLYLGPIVRNVIADVRAVRFDIRAWRFQRKLNRRWHL
jgi:hypothetical protein